MSTLTDTAGGSDPFVYTFTVAVITCGAILLAHSNIVKLVDYLFHYLWGAKVSQKPTLDPKVQFSLNFISFLCTGGIHIALPALATHFFYTNRSTALFTSPKNYRDTVWISFLWIYASSAILMSIGIWGRKIKWWTKNSDTDETIGKAVAWVPLLTTIGVPVIGMGINAQEMWLNLNSPTPVIFIIDIVLYAIYAMGSFYFVANRSEKTKDAIQKILLQTGTKLTLDCDPSKVSPSAMVHLRPGGSEVHLVSENSLAHRIVSAAEPHVKSGNPAFANGYAFRAIEDEVGNPEVYMLGKTATKVYDSLWIPSSSARLHADLDEHEPPVLQVIDSAGVADDITKAFRNIMTKRPKDLKGQYMSDPYFMGVLPSEYFSFVVDEDVIVLYNISMLAVWLLTLRCSATASMMWILVNVLPMLFALAPKFEPGVEMVDRRDQWAYLQAYFGSVGLSLVGLTYTVFPTLPLNGFYITRPAIWQFASNSNNFWWTGGNFAYNGIEIVTIVQFIVFGLLAIWAFYAGAYIAYQWCCRKRAKSA